MVETGKPADDSAANKKNQTATTESETRTDALAKTTDSSGAHESPTAAIEQIAVDNQTGTLPGTKPPEKSPVNVNGQLEITPLQVSANRTAGADAATEPTAKPGDESKPDAAKPGDAAPAEAKPEGPKPRTRAEELAQTVPYLSFQDGRTDAIDLTVQRASLLPKGDKARELVLRDLSDAFENGKTYGERVRAAKALLELTRDRDGKVPTNIVDRDVVTPEKGHWTTATRGASSKYVVDAAPKHEMKPLTSADVLKFLNNSADTIEQQTKALKGAPADNQDRHNLQQKLLSVFQTYGQDSPEKIAAAKGLLELNRKPDGTYPSDLGTRDVEHPRQTRKERGRDVVVKQAWTEHITTKLTDVESYLGRRSEGLLADTAKAVEGKGVDSSGLAKRAVDVFLDSQNSGDKTAAAIALLELGKGPDGKVSEQLGTRTVHIPAKTQVVSGGRGSSTVKTLEAARDRVDNVSKTDAIRYLETQLSEYTYPRTRMMAADALKGAGVIDEKRHGEIVKAILSDDRTPEALRTQLRTQTSADVQQEALKQESDGRVVKDKPPNSIPLDTAPGGARDKMEVLMEKLVTIKALKDATTPEQIEAMNKELAEGRFGPASRDIYNKTVTYMNDMSTGLAVNIVARNGKLPEGMPLDVPKDPSGRAIGDDLLRAQLITGRTKMDMPTVKPGELPDVDRLTDTALWNVKAAKEFDNMNLRWEVEMFDDRLQMFNKNGKLDAWKSTDNMSIDDMRKLQTARGEWLQLGMQVRNYAHAIHYFNKATHDASNIPRLSISGAEFGVFSDEALSDKNFPGKVTRENGKITNVEIDMPTTLDRSDPANLEKVAKMKAWLEKYGPKVDQVTEEITKATLDSGRVAMWGDIEHEGIDKATGKPYNFTSLRISADTVKVKLPDGTEEERIRVVSSKQNRYAGGLSLYKTVGDIQDVGPPETSGEVRVNGKVLSLDAGDNGVAVGAKGDIAVTGDGVSPQHARMRVAADGRIFIKDNDSATGTYVGGQRIDGSKWVEVFPDQKVTLGKPPVSLDIARKENGEVTFNGQALKVGEPAKIGTSCAINVTGDGVSSEHAMVKVDADGKVYIKDNNSEKGTYVNGRKVGANEWTQVGDSDKVTFGPPAADLDIKADVRLYKKGDMVTVLVDGQMQLMPAENIKAWTTEAATWHWTGKGAMAAMDLGMLVSGGIALKGVQVAAVQGVKEAGALTAKAVLARMVTTPGFARGAWHLGLGATGLLHQSIENSGPYGKKFMEYRGYAMMGEIFYGSFIKDGAAVARKAFGMTAAPTETGSALSSYLKASPWANRAMNVTDGMFLAMNGYFLPEIAAHQMPAIMSSIRKHDAARLLEAGMLLRDSKYEKSDDGAPRVTLEDQVRKFSNDQTRDLITQAKKDAEETAALPDDQQKVKKDYVEKLTNQFLNPKDDNEKTAAAFGLLAFQARVANNGKLPEVLGTRWRSASDIPDNVTATQIKAYLNTKIPASLNLHDKQLQARVEANYGDVARVAEKPVDDPARKALNERMIREFATAPDENTKVAAAMGLMLLNENGGKLPDSLGTTKGTDGKNLEVKSSDVRNLLTKHQANALTEKFDSYASSMKGNPKVDAVLKSTRDFLAESELPPAVREAEQVRLMKLFETSTDREEKAAVALSLLFLNTDKSTGAIPSTLGTQHFRVEREYKSTPYAMAPSHYSPVMVPPTVTINKIPVSLTPQEKTSYATTGSIADYRGGRTSKVEIEARNLQTADVMQFLKSNMPTFSPNTRLAVSDVLYRANEAPMAGGSVLNDQGGVLLSIVEDKKAPTEARIQALINPHGLGLADVMEIHRFETEPGIRKLPDREAAATEADIYGRDSKAMEKALLDIVAEPGADKDLKAIASATLMANSEADPSKRREMLAQIVKDYDALKATPGAYYNQVFKAESDVVKSMWKDDEFKPEGDEGRSKLYRSAIILSQSGNWKEFGISDEKMARALEATFVPQQPIVAQHTLDPLLRHYKDLDDYSKQLNRENFKSLIGSSQGGVNTPGYLLRQDVINRVGEIAKVLGPEFTTMAREQFVAMLTPGTDQYRGTDESTRAAAVRGLGQIGSNDIATQELLKRVLGDGKTAGDASPLVRSAALDGLTALHPADMNVLAANLLKSETDPEILRKLGNLEKSTRRLDPDSAEYREQFRQAYNRLMEAGANKYSLAEVPNFIAKNYPMLDWQRLNNTVVDRMKQNEGSYKWASTKYADIIEPYFTQARAEVFQQLDSIVAKAATADGDMERRTLAWIVMSNGKFMDESTKQQAIEKASYGLFKAAKEGDAKTKEAVAPLLLMAVATQDRMPPGVRHTLVNAVTWLDPGAPGSPVSKQDAGIAVLAGLKRQFERTPRDGNDPSYKASHDLQMQMLNIYSRYAGQEAIPVLEAMTASQSKFSLGRDSSDRLNTIKYPDQSTRTVDYNANNEIWRVSVATKDGAQQTLVRNGLSNEWYAESDASKKTIWRGTASIDQVSGKFQTTDSFGKTIVYTAEGSVIEKTGDQVNKVTYADHSSREIAGNRETYIDAAGNKQVWIRDGVTNNWYRDTDNQKKTAWVGTLGFDADGNYISQQQGVQKTIIRTDGSRVTYDNNLPVMSTPSAADNSAHPMPMVRERAQELLSQLRDGTDILRTKTVLDTNSTPQQLADNLRLALEKGNANSEEVARAIFTAALSRPIDSADDPRREVLRGLLEDKHEKVRLAAARVLFDSGVATSGGAEVVERNRVVSKQDKELAAAVLADLYKNGSRSGYRDEAGQLIRTVLGSQKEGEPRSESAQIIDAAMEKTPSARRADIDNPNQPRSIDQQEKYEQATGAMIRDTQISLDALSSSDWWKSHGFGLLEANSYRQSKYEAADAVSFNMWEKLQYIWDGDPAKAKMRTAMDNLNNQRDEQLTKLKERALSNDNGEEATTARKALALIVLSNGYPLTPDIRDRTVTEAARTLSTIYKKGGPAADYAEQIITAALVANPGIRLDVRAEFVSAVRSRLAQDASVNGNASNVKAATLLAAALEAEHYNMPKNGQPGYEASINFQSNVLMHLDRLGESIALPVIEAMAKGHPDADLQRRSTRLFNEMRDGTNSILNRTAPDITTPNADKAKALTALLNRKETPATEQDTVREIFRLAHPQTLSKDDPNTASDPRLEPLRNALKHDNERIRLAAASALWSSGDPRAVVAIAELQDAKRAGVRQEAETLYGANFLMRGTAKIDAESEKFLRGALNENSDRARVAAARMLLEQFPQDAQASAALAKAYGSGNAAVRAEAKELIQKLNESTIREANDPRRAALEQQLTSENANARIAAAWMLSTSSVPGDYEKVAATVGNLAYLSDTKSDARSLLKDFIAHGSDAQQEVALVNWNAAWKAAGSPADDKPPAATEATQAQKYFRQANATERSAIFSMPEAEKKAMVMQLTGMSEAELEAQLEPAPMADVIPRTQTIFDPLRAFDRRSDLMFPLPGTRYGDNQSLFPLNSRFQPSTNNRWNQAIPGGGDLSITGLNGGDSRPYFSGGKNGFRNGDTTNGANQSRINFANFLSSSSRTDAKVNVTPDGKLELALDDQVKFGQTETPPEFSDFLDYLHTQRPDVLEKPTIKSSELSVMFLQYLRQREAGLQTGFMVTPQLYDNNVAMLTSDPRAVPWYSSGRQRDGLSPRQWRDFSRQREQARNGNLDAQLVKALASEVPNGNGPHWRPAQKAEVARPDVLTQPAVELLEVNRYDFTSILPQELLRGRQPAIPAFRPRIADTQKSFVIPMADGKGRPFVIPRTEPGAAVSTDIEIPTAMLRADRFKTEPVSDKITILPSPTDARRPQKVQTFSLSPAAQDILKRYRVIQLQGHVDTLNRVTDAGK